MKRCARTPIAPFTTLRVGGEARELVTVDTEADLVDAVREADARGDAVLVLGGGSNVVVADEGFDGRVVRVATRGVTTTRADDLVHVRAAAGEPWDALVARTVQDDLAGLECLSGIPGLVGATPIQNVGAYGQEVSDTITAVRAWDRRDACVVTLGPADCAFGYRDSAFKSAMPGRHVVLDVTFALRPDGAPAVRYGELSRALARLPSPTLTATRDAVLALRRAKSMVLDDDDPESRSAGSFFTNPVVDAAVADAVARRAVARGVLRADESMPRFDAPGGGVKLAAGWLIERAGVARGETQGLVAVSRKHALALVTREGARASDVVTLALDIRRRVREAWDVTLTPEPVRVGFVCDPFA